MNKEKNDERIIKDRTVHTDKIFARIENIEKINLISINKPDRSFLDKNLTKQFKTVLELKFWDIEEDFGHYKTITKEQGKEIKDFIIKNKDFPFLIHCAAGISRSAGVGCAIECLLNYNGDNYSYQTGHSDVKEHWRYSPNQTVFDSIIKN